MARPTRMIFINEAAGGTPIKLAFDAIGGPDFKLLAEGMGGTLVTYNQVLPEPAAVARFGLRSSADRLRSVTHNPAVRFNLRGPPTSDRSPSHFCASATGSTPCPRDHFTCAAPFMALRPCERKRHLRRSS